MLHSNQLVKHRSIIVEFGWVDRDQLSNCVALVTQESLMLRSHYTGLKLPRFIRLSSINKYVGLGAGGGKLINYLQIFKN